MSAKQHPITSEALLSTLLLACLLAALGLVLLGPRFLGLGFLTIYGGSMEPAVPLGAMAITKQSPPEAVRVGDVIAFRSIGGPQQMVTHRVVGVAAGPAGLSFRTQGDANDSPDSEPVPAANLVGVVVASVPFLGYVAHYARTPLGAGLLLLSLLVPSLLVFRLELGHALRWARAGGRRLLLDGVPFHRLNTCLLLLAAAAAAAGMQQMGAARGDFADTERASARIVAGTWIVPTTLRAGVSAEPFLPGAQPGGALTTTNAGAQPSGTPASANAGARGEIDLSNTGRSAATNLNVVAQVQYRIGAGAYGDLAGAAQAFAPGALAAGAALKLPYEISFAPVPGATEYQVLVRATITNYSGHLGQPYGPEAAVVFSLPILPEVTPTPTPTVAAGLADTATPSPTLTSVPENLPAPTTAPTSTATPTVAVTATPTQTATPTETPTSTATPTGTAMATPTQTATPTEAPTATATPTSAVTATPTPTSTFTPVPTDGTAEASTSTCTPSPEPTGTAAGSDELAP